MRYPWVNLSFQLVQWCATYVPIYEENLVCRENIFRNPKKPCFWKIHSLVLRFQLFNLNLKENYQKFWAIIKLVFTCLTFFSATFTLTTPLATTTKFFWPCRCAAVEKRLPTTAIAYSDFNLMSKFSNQTPQGINFYVKNACCAVNFSI